MSPRTQAPCILAATFIIGLATLLSFYHPSGAEKWMDVLSVAGFFFAVVLGIYVAWGILRTGGD